MSAIVLKPVKNQLNFLNDLTGRDKASKFVQYGLRFLLYVQQMQGSPNPDTQRRMQVLMNQISLARKVFRSFKFLGGYVAFIEFVEQLVGDMKGFQKKSIDQKVNSVFNAMKKLFLHTYLFFDGIGFLGKIGILSKDGYFSQANFKGHVLKGYKFWMFANIFSVLHSVFNLLFARMCYQIAFTRMKKQGAEKADFEELDEEYYPIQYKEGRNFVKSVCDLLVSSKFAGYHSQSDGLIGLYGMISSVAGGYDLWAKYQK